MTERITRAEIARSELRLAMICAHQFWSGTSISEGAFAIMRDVRRTHPEQFKTDEK